MKKFFITLLTESDNVTPDLVRCMALVAIAFSWLFQLAAIWKGVPFSMQDFGAGQGLLFGGVGIAMRLKGGGGAQ